MQGTKLAEKKSSFAPSQTGVLEQSSLQNNLLMRSSTAVGEPSDRPPMQRGITFSNPMGHGKGDMMSKSFVNRAPSNTDIEAFIRDAKDKFFKMSKTLHEHEEQLNNLRDSRITSTSEHKEPISLGPYPSTEIIRNLQRELESEQNKTKMILHQVERLRNEVNMSLKKDEFQFNLARFEVRLIDNFTLKKDFIREVSDLRQKLGVECRTLYEVVKKQIEGNILHIHDANRIVFSKIEKDMTDVKQTIETNDKAKSIFTSNKKFYDPKIIKYKQTVQKISDKIYEKPGQEITISQTVYYLDRDGYLLDKSYNYLVDQNNSQIQLDNKHINLLRFYNLM